MMVAAARCLRDGAVCFVGIGLPSTAANLARRTHAPNLVLVYESGTLGSKPESLPLSIGDGELADTADSVISVPGGLQLLAAARAHRRRVPRRRPDRPLRQHQLDRDRRLRTPRRCACRAPAARRRSPPPAGEVVVLLRQTAAGVRRARRLRVLGGLRRRARPPRAARACAARGPQVVVTDLGVLRPDPVDVRADTDRAASRVDRRAGACGDRVGPRRRR